jgi:tetratricopeptide (TPR) repeat protein
MGMGGFGGGGYGGGGYGGGGYGGGGYGGGGYGNGGYAANGSVDTTSGNLVDPNQAPAQPGAAPSSNQVAAANDFDQQAEAAFKAGNYEDAIHDWQHALLDTPTNAALMMLMAQALFAEGKFGPAAGAVEIGMNGLPQDQWGTVVKHYGDLYGNPADYATQLRALETARDQNPKEPANHFLLGYFYGYNGYPKEAVREFDTAINERPKDRAAVAMRNTFASGAGVAALPMPEVPKQPAGQPAGAPGSTPTGQTSTVQPNG